MPNSAKAALDPDNATEGDKNKLRHMTYVYAIFVFLQLFN